MSKEPTKQKNPARYDVLIENIFIDRYTKDATRIEFERIDIETAAAALEIPLPKNLGDVLYSYRFRKPLPDKILATQPEGREWIIQLAGRAKYRFRLAKANRIIPNKNLTTIKIPDNTPEIIARYALDDEQALLAKVRYNRLIDIFLGMTTFSLQNHLRTTVEDLGQIEIDELYIGIDKYGCHYVIPVQAKGGKDQISIVQTEQDTKWCEQKFPLLRCRAISAQFVSKDQIALFELQIVDKLENGYGMKMTTTNGDDDQVRKYVFKTFDELVFSLRVALAVNPHLLDMNALKKRDSEVADNIAQAAASLLNAQAIIKEQQAEIEKLKERAEAKAATTAKRK